MRPELDARRIELALNLDEHLVIEADRAQLEQVILNVLRNAADAIEGEGRIAVTCDGDGLAVRDSGPGIADEIRDDLFTPFFSTRRDGRGLGLTIVQEILTNHGFAYALENQPGGGPQFRITW